MELGPNTENGPVTLNLSDDISNVHDRRENCGVERIETQEKKTRFSLSHDEGTLSLESTFSLNSGSSKMRKLKENL